MNNFATSIASLEVGGKFFLFHCGLAGQVDTEPKEYSRTCIKRHNAFANYVQTLNYLDYLPLWGKTTRHYHKIRGSFVDRDIAEIDVVQLSIIQPA